MLRLDGIVFTIINLIVLYLILRHFLIGPIRNIMQKRDEMLAKQFADAKAKEEQAAEMKTQYEALILENAKARADSEYEKRLDQAKKEADKVVQRANVAASQEKEKMLGDVQSQISALALTAARKVLLDGDTKEQNAAFYREFTKKAGETYDTDIE